MPYFHVVSEGFIKSRRPIPRVPPLKSIPDGGLQINELVCGTTGLSAPTLMIVNDVIGFYVPHQASIYHPFHGLT